MKIYLNFFCLLLLLSCQKKNEYSSIKIIGHAGNGLENSASFYHDNSKESIELALSYEGCDGVEVDVQLSKNGTTWLYHDTHLESQTKQNGCISTSSDEILNKTYYKSLNKEKLFQLLHISKSSLINKCVFLDLRHYNYCEENYIETALMINQIKNFILYHPNTEINVITNYTDWLKELKSLDVNIFYSIENQFDKSLFDFPEIESCVFKNKQVSKNDIDYCRQKGKKIAIFEVRSPKSIKEALEKYPDYIISDDLKSCIIEKY
ncbi:MAG: hypothetical protein HYU67_09170 [Flavobacteriia bacterium]|nr:hypothetical protein [Flavobacteriia bacterium]